MAIKPGLIAHSDWSTNPAKRWMACALLQPDGSYGIAAPQPVGDTGALLSNLHQSAGDCGPVLAGFDFPIGLPLFYTQRCGIEDFPTALLQFGCEGWADFYRVAEAPEQISLRRPFYPMRPGTARQAHLLNALGVKSMDGLRRACELPHSGRRSAAPLFWTLGSQQVGKAAITGWREILTPALRQSEFQVALWPFSGSLEELLTGDQIILVETYPAEYYRFLGVLPRHAGVPTGFSKRSQAARAASATALLKFAALAGLRLDPDMNSEILMGFGPSPLAEDRFDAAVGLFGMLAVVLGLLPAGEPSVWNIRHVEGWILGLSTNPALPPAYYPV